MALLTLRQMDFFGWWLEQQLPTAQASFSAEKIRLSERGRKPFSIACLHLTSHFADIQFNQGLIPILNH